MAERVTAGERATVPADFANHILGDWDSAMSQFFGAVERKMRDRGLTVVQVREALDLGYGDEIAWAWIEYMDETG